MLDIGNDAQLIVTPIIFLYPEFGQFDYIEEASDDIQLWAIFEEIFKAGLPWDQKQFYTDASDLRYFVMVKILLIEEKWDKESGRITRNLAERRRRH